VCLLLSKPVSHEMSSLLAFRGADCEGRLAHLRRASRLGATKEELFEVLEATLVPSGALTFHRGLSALLEVEKA
jgi:alkylhydroperoxidase/carboxymuconolactone decarboxylase family protein YurZ